jgi:23S rRNA (adenine2503-C2)-methyltransferase
MKVLHRHDLLFSTDVRSRKYLIGAKGDPVAVECAFLFRGESTSLCASCQAGCSFGCRHCATTYAPVPFQRNLSPAEMVETVRLVVDDANQGRQLDYLDFSGVGECSANWEAVRQACLECKASGLAAAYRLTSIAPRNWCLTVAEELEKSLFAPDRIVISLHGASREARRRLIPSAEDPWKAAGWWRMLRGRGGAIDLNYAVHQENTTDEQLDELVRFVSVHANWIRELRLSSMNPVPGMHLRTPDSFKEIAAVLRSRIPAQVQINAFTSIGSSISMACGQMRALLQISSARDSETSVTVATSITG